jgi:hypothetical protein
MCVLGTDLCLNFLVTVGVFTPPPPTPNPPEDSAYFAGFLESVFGQRTAQFSRSKLRKLHIFQVMTGLVMRLDVAVGGQNGPLFILLCIVCLSTPSVAQALHRRNIGRCPIRLLKRSG